MKAPDKIYLHPDFEGSQTPSVFWSTEKRGSHPEECVEYIRKDALLEWAKDAIQNLSDGSLTGYYESLAYQDLIDKLNEM